MVNLSIVNRIKKVLYSQSGMALPTVLLVMVVLVILGVAILNTTLSEASFAVEQNQKTQAHYLGRSGVLLGYEKLKAMTQNPADYGYDGTIDQLLIDLNTWASTNAGSMQLDTKDQFNLTYTLINNNELKIKSDGLVNGVRTTSDTVSLRVQMLRSLLNGGRADAWYNGNGLTLDHATDPAQPAETYIGKGVFLTGKDSQSTKFPSNAGSPVFRASIIQFLADNSNICLEYSGNTAETTFDAEIIIFSGNVVMNGNSTKRDDMYLTLSNDPLALDKVNNSSSTLYVSDATVRTALAAGAGFENPIYHEYFSGEVYAGFAAYGMDITKRYGVVQFERPLKYGTTNAILADYYYFPSGVNLSYGTTASATDLDVGSLIPIESDDPIIDRIKAINRVTVDISAPYMWDNK